MTDLFPAEGGCDCKAIRYSLQCKPLFVHCCHCKWCQCESGAAFALNAMVESDYVVNLGAEPEVIHTPSDSGRGQMIARCPQCKVAVWSKYAGAGPIVKFVRVGTLDNPDLCPPDIHIFTQSKQAWFQIPEGTPAVAEYYDREKYWPAESLARRQAMLPAIEAYQAGTAKPYPAPDLTATAVRALILYSLLEFQSGHATTIHVTAEGTAFSIADDGRGHPLDRTVEGTSYLKFIYTHFDYPFEAGRSAPIQLQGIGISLVNAMCSELALTVTKKDETLQVLFRQGQLQSSNRTSVVSDKTGISISAKLSAHLQTTGVNTKALEEWLQGLLVSDPTLKLVFNGRALQAPEQIQPPISTTNLKAQ